MLVPQPNKAALRAATAATAHQALALLLLLLVELNALPAMGDAKGSASQRGCAPLFGHMSRTERRMCCGQYAGKPCSAHLPHSKGHANHIRLTSSVYICSADAFAVQMHALLVKLM